MNDRLPGFISVWDIVAQKWVRHWQVHESSGEFPARFSPDRCPKCRFVPLAISPDGALVATASGNNVVLWEAATGKERRRLTDRDVVCALAFAPDGTLASGSCDSTILLWNPYQHTGDRPGSDRFAELWQVLADEDAGKAFAAMCALAAAGPKAADFLYARLKPTAEQVAQGKRIQSLVEALDDPSFAKREAAQQQLAKCGRQAEGALRAALRNSKSNELTKRGRELLATITSQPRSASERRRLRAVEALAHAHADSYLQKLARTKTAVGYEAAIYCHLREKTMGNRP
ncbi:MAG: hypothetical protein KatS3mg105_0612 [Gemmatales bacterium]|nr:MAG: hypothetical protein KatS3mg105_0612 [Gemmatales bacterium]